MCTAIGVKDNNKVIFGRNMDFSIELNPEIYIVPACYEWQNSKAKSKVKNKYKFIGTGQNIGGIMFADGMNEFGLGVAALYFMGFADYKKELNPNKTSIANYDLVNYLLGNFSSVKEIINNIQNINIVGIEDDLTKSIAPLHWMVIDEDDSIVIEVTMNGLQIFNNPVNVLTNSPDFTWHLTNLRNYLNLSNEQLESKKWDNLVLTPFGQGSGSFGLPGDYTSPSRFIRTSFIKNNTLIPTDDEEAINTCFNILKSTFITKGLVITSRNTYDYTQYTVFMNLKSLEYYISTYHNNEIKKVSLNDYNPNNIYSLGRINDD